MLEIEDRIADLAVGIVARRRIDVNPSPVARGVGSVPPFANVAVGHVLGKVVIDALLGDLYPAGLPAPAEKGLARRVAHPHVVDSDKVVVEAWRLRIAGGCPAALGVFLGRISLAELEFNL